ncbi:MAG: gamma-glutamyltransferase [Cyclobacteriaceae bacterium]|nr:gamma-glutamyltransferase [Cyclobacteriaceae bacterium]
MQKPVFILFTFFIFLSCNTGSEKEKPAQTGLIAENAMVVTAHPIASHVGKAILAKGGNAIDAAVAVKFSLAVVFPFAGNIGGGGFMVYRASDGSTNTLDFREMAPAKAHRDMYLDSAGNVIKDLSIRGHLAVGVPGSVDGMVEAHSKYGLLPWAELVQPAIDLATLGFPVTKREADGFNRINESLKELNTIEPSHLLKEWNTGDTIYHLDLASTLVRIRDNGRAGFYEGETAALFVEEMERGGGFITQKDLNNYHSIWRTPITSKYKEYTVITMPPPSSGGIALTQLLQSVEDYDLKKLGHNSAEYVHLLTEAERRVYADRAEYLGDMDFYNVPIKQLTTPAYNKERMQSFNPKRATPSDSIGSGKILFESNQTTHFSIVDAQGNAVAITTTLNGAFGSRVIVGKAGFLLNNEMDDFSVKPGVSNMFGLVGGEANAIAPGKRMLSSMTPTIVEQNGKLLLVTGSPGGATIITSVFQSIINVIEFDMTMQESVNALRTHNQWLPDVIMYERGALSEENIKKLEEMGHKMLDRGNIGRVNAVKALENGKLEGAADPRGDDLASGF